MIFIKKVFILLANLGKICIIIIVLCSISAFAVSISIKNEKIVNPYCAVKNEMEVNISSKYIEYYDSFYSCNTLYINISANDSLTLENIKDFKEELNKQLMIIDDYFIHIEIEGKNIDLTYFCYKN